jgi:hypothetical protein
MKKIWFSLLTIIICTSLLGIPNPGSVRAQPALPEADPDCGSDPSQVACWHMEGNINDASGNGNNGTTTGDPSWMPGHAGQALLLNGLSQNAIVPHSGTLNITGAITLAAWIRPGKKALQSIISKEIYQGTSGYGLSLSSDNLVFVRFGHAGSSYRLASTSTYPIDNITWMHVAATFDGAYIRLYINGIQENVGSMVIPIDSNALDLAIGSESPGGASPNYYNGTLDDVYIYNRALDSTEIQTLANKPPNQPASPTPSSGAIVELKGGHHLALETIVTDTDNATGLTVRFYGRPYPLPDFSLAVLPDTQHYTSGENSATREMFDDQTSWIVNNRAGANIVYVAHLGDVVDNSEDTAQWDIAGKVDVPKGAMTALDLAGIRYGIALGNKDGYESPYGTANFNFYFHPGRVGDGRYSVSDNDNHYGLFSADGMNFIIIFLEYNPTPNPAVLAWADNLLNVNPSRRGIVVFHDLIDADNPAILSSAGQTVYNALGDNPNLFLMLGGHASPEAEITLTGSGHTIYALRSDYQDRDGGGNGWMRLMEFQPAYNQIQVSTFSPYLNYREIDADSQFTLSYDMGGTGIEDFQLLSTQTGVASGSTVSYQWNELSDGSRYQWMVTVSDPVHTTIGPSWWFTSSPPTAVSLTDFQATAIPQAIMLNWHSTQEIDLLGFNVYRAETNDRPRALLNPQIIPALNPGQPLGNPYQFEDNTAEVGKTYYYWVEWVGTTGSQTYGPISASLFPYATWLPLGLK